MVNAELIKNYYPYNGHYMQLQTARMHYLDQGEGPVLLALHGNPTWSIYYRHLIDGLQDSYRLVVPDHIGCGLSDKPDDTFYSYRLEQRVRDIETLVEQLDLKDITLVLHDWGGMIGLAFACRNPHLIKKIVLMNTAGFGLPPRKGFPLALALSRSDILGAVLVRGFNAFALTASYICCQKHSMPAPLRRAYRAPYDNWEHRRAVHRFVQDIPLSEKDPSWALVQYVSENLVTLQDKPLLVIWGEKDFVFDTNFLAEWRRRWPQAEFHSYPEAGHYILEDLGDEAVQLIRKFLQRPLPPSALH